MWIFPFLLFCLSLDKIPINSHDLLLKQPFRTVLLKSIGMEDLGQEYLRHFQNFARNLIFEGVFPRNFHFDRFANVNSRYFTFFNLQKFLPLRVPSVEVLAFRNYIETVSTRF